jgi:hypothetical protein
VHPNADVAQSKVLVDPLLGGLLEERKIDPRILRVTLKTNFKRLFFGALLKMLLGPWMALRGKYATLGCIHQFMMLQ